MALVWTLAMTLVQVISAGVNVFYKMAYNVGFSLRILVVYRFYVATIVILPFALTLERGRRPRLTWRIVGLGILAGFFGGALGQNLFAGSFAYASTTYVAAISNLSPAITYILALVFRTEIFRIATWRQRARLVGTIIEIMGAMVITFYRGLSIHLGSTSMDLLHHFEKAALPEVHRPVVGAVLAFGSCICFPAFLFILTTMTTTHGYPVFSSLLLMCVSSSVLSTIYAVAVQKTWSSWHLELDVRLLAIIYSGTLASGLLSILVAWCSQQKGPTFVSTFSPFSLIFTAFMGPLLLHEETHIGSIIGGALVFIGVYLIVWGSATNGQPRGDGDTAIEGNSGGDIEMTEVQSSGHLETIGDTEITEIQSSGHLETIGDSDVPEVQSSGHIGLGE
ncbi:hypothetical protein PTKIN_Ptkin08bG0154600 [Pterospermum kingtungense]